ncbi:MAG: nucleotidyltransferase family protein [Eubacteriales bacterium]|nr:nucleotidyltransferase family protein [Clostridiales bacterium]MDD6931690.1 nucleotidyltransferase family protein [Eubacteriales bacterium]MDY2600196.1 nucleotidyltransferase family protein [Eubacteriales bacterium]
MKLAAIICEYNPFHRGHALQLAETRKSGYDGIVCIMDGHLTQRGRFAALSKWDRAKAALLCGADAVVELPALLACRSADAFARAGVAIARALGAEALSFGCETDDLSLLRRAAAFQEDAVFRAHLEAQLARGVSFPRARGAALAACLKLSPEQAEALSRPNAILAMEYLRALAAPGSPAPLVVLRRGEYHSPELGPYASASALRAAALRGDQAGESALPDKARFQWPLLSARREIDDLFLWALRSGPDFLATLPEISEGLENRVSAAARAAASAEEALEQAKCRRYTRARLDRLAAHALTGLTAELTRAHPAPEYLRLLGAGNSQVLREIARRATLPMLDAARLRENAVFRFECHVTDLWALTRTLPRERQAGQEFTRPFVRP